MTPTELEVALLNADLEAAGRLAPRQAEVIDLASRRQSLRPTPKQPRAQTEADHWAQRHRDGDDCA